MDGGFCRKYCVACRVASRLLSRLCRSLAVSDGPDKIPVDREATLIYADAYPFCRSATSDTLSLTVSARSVLN